MRRSRSALIAPRVRIGWPHCQPNTVAAAWPTVDHAGALALLRISHQPDGASATPAQLSSAGCNSPGRALIIDGVISMAQGVVDGLVGKISGGVDSFSAPTAHLASPDYRRARRLRLPDLSRHPCAIGPLRHRARSAATARGCVDLERWFRSPPTQQQPRGLARRGAL
jgi:hypothetical protein